MRREVKQRTVALSIITHGAVNPLNVWDLPLWSWRHYVAEHDEFLRVRAEANRGR